MMQHSSDRRLCMHEVRQCQHTPVSTPHRTPAPLTTQHTRPTKPPQPAGVAHRQRPLTQRDRGRAPSVAAPAEEAAAVALAASVCTSADSVCPKNECEMAWNGVMRSPGSYASILMIKSLSLR
mmetsp:Transcript_59738/g.118681  ORF Transcript_59738/g.118681 Transcript_59738/m.118681 type:complete len:123 (+) Transcript_59738:417-785(+)